MKVIITHGDTMLHQECPKCHCEFLYQDDDIKLSETRVNAYESKTDYTYVVCPECGKMIKLKEYDTGR